MKRINMILDNELDINEDLGLAVYNAQIQINENDDVNKHLKEDEEFCLAFYKDEVCVKELFVDYNKEFQINEI